MKDAESGKRSGYDQGVMSVTTKKVGLGGGEYIVNYNVDSYCQYYFFSTTEDSGSMISMPNLMKASYGNGRVWTVVNKACEQTWKRQYPAKIVF